MKKSVLVLSLLAQFNKITPDMRRIIIFLATLLLSPRVLEASHSDVDENKPILKKIEVSAHQQKFFDAIAEQHPDVFVTLGNPEAAEIDINAYNKLGDTTLGMAVRQFTPFSSDLVPHILKWAEINRPNFYTKQTPLEILIYHSPAWDTLPKINRGLALFNLLKEKGGTINAQQNPTLDGTAVRAYKHLLEKFPTQAKNYYIILVFLSENGFNIDQIMLFEAIQNNEPLDIIKALLNKSTIKVNELDEKGDSLLHVAVRTMHEDSEKIVDALLAHGASVNIKDDVYHKTPLYTLLFNSDKWDTDQKFSAGVAIFKKLSDRSTQLGPQSEELLPQLVEYFRENFLPRFSTKKNKQYLAIIEFLLQQKFNPNYGTKVLPSARSLTETQWKIIEKDAIGPAPDNYTLPEPRFENGGNTKTEEKIDRKDGQHYLFLVKSQKTGVALPEVLELFDKYFPQPPSSPRTTK